jgi:uncharacterized protein YjbI with pentapeptide repeats
VSYVEIKHTLVGKQMPSSPSTRRLIPTWLIITTAVFVIVALFFFASGGLSLLRLFSVTETKTTHTTSEQGQVVSKEKEKATTQQRLTFWDALGLVFVPVAGGVIITIVSYIYNKKQREREEAVQSLRAQDAALQQYLDQMSDLLVNRGLRPEPADSEPKGLQKYRDRVNDLLVNLNLRSEPADSEPKDYVRNLAQARTIAVLLGLDSEHKKRPLKLVYELGLIEKDNRPLELKNAGLDGANLSEITLRAAYLRCVDLRLSDLKGADLEGSNLNLADLRGSDLKRANLRDVDLTKANLLPYDAQDPERLSIHNQKKTNNLSKESIGSARHSKLTITNLRGATLTGARLHETLLGSADLTNADLTGADLTGAVLTDAVLTDAVLNKAEGVTWEQLSACESLAGATMPNGQKYEDWLKTKGREENSGPS